MTTDCAVRGGGAPATRPLLIYRLCGSSELRSFLDLGATPPCELFLTAAAAQAPELTYPLHVRVCDRCLLAQLPPSITPEDTFTEYAYFSSFSTSWVEHARRFVDGAVERFGLTADSFVVEVASNDGYLLRPEILDYLPEGGDLIADGAMVLAKEGRMPAYRHRGFWQPADTIKELTAPEAAYQGGTRAWMLWEKPDRSPLQAAIAALHER